MVAQTLDNLSLEHVFSVGEYVTLVNDLISPLEVSVQGEVTDLKIAREWVFFSLKDKDTGAVLRCGLHASVYKRIGVPLEDGMEIKVAGHSRLTPKSGNFGFWVEQIAPLGQGSLKRAYELLFAQFEKEGLFQRKRVLPECIKHIGVISSRDGVVIHDLMKNLRKRGIRIDFLHSAVDGEKSANELIKAVEYFSHTKEKPDVVVIIRGGGSLESLQGFNNEALCRAIFACPMPVVAGIGHDVDVPLAAMTADASASTPTAVAMLINATWDDVALRVPHLEEQMYTYIKDRLDVLAQLPDGYIVQICDTFSYRLKNIGQEVTHLARVLAFADPERLFERGLSVVYKDTKIVRNAQELANGDAIKVRMKGGTVSAQINNHHA